MTPRGPIPYDRYKNLIKAGVFPEEGLDVTHPAVRESLIEHVGHLPMLASFLYPHIEHKDEVDLGRVLIMLSIHDIGETVTGDVITYMKDAKDEEREHKITEKIVHPDLKEYFTEYETRESYDAKFAKSVDALAPILHDIDNYHIARRRFEHYNFSADTIYKKQKKNFEWDAVLLELFELVADYNEKIENGEEFQIISTEYHVSSIK